MAYLRDLNTTCQRCSGAAKVELLSNRNATHGKYCKKCGVNAQRELNAIEKRENLMLRKAKQEMNAPRCRLCGHLTHEPNSCGVLDAAGSVCGC